MLKKKSYDHAPLKAFPLPGGCTDHILRVLGVNPRPITLGHLVSGYHSPSSITSRLYTLVNSGIASRTNHGEYTLTKAGRDRYEAWYVRRDLEARFPDPLDAPRTIIKEPTPSKEVTILPPKTVYDQTVSERITSVREQIADMFGVSVEAVKVSVSIEGVTL